MQKKRVPIDSPGFGACKSGTWTETFTYQSTAAFLADVKRNFPYPGKASPTCTIEYKLTFTSGVPSKFMDLL